MNTSFVIAKDAETIVKPFLTTAEAAALLDMTDSGVRRMILTGRLPAQRAGKRVWLIRPADLHGIQRSKAGRPTSPPK